jgi:hypothetical protein
MPEHPPRPHVNIRSRRNRFDGQSKRDATQEIGQRWIVVRDVPPGLKRQFIGLGTGNVIENLDPQTYKKDWVVYVTDSNGVAVANKDLTIKVLPVEYRKGHLMFNEGWTYDPLVQTCANEDTDYTGVVTPGKDFDHSGNLQPGNVVLVTTTQTPNAAASGIARTDSTGRATLTLLYAESYAFWVKVRLTAQATVSGTESSNAQEFYVPGLASDFTSEENPPAGTTSPFGVNACNVPF